MKTRYDEVRKHILDYRNQVEDLVLQSNSMRLYARYDPNYYYVVHNLLHEIRDPVLVSYFKIKQHTKDLTLEQK